MANYGRGWGDGYGGQSAESIDAYHEQQEREAGQIQNAKRQRERELERQSMTTPTDEAVEREKAVVQYDGVVSKPRAEPNAFKRQCFRDGWDAAIAALPDMVQPLVWYNAGTEIQSQSLIHFYRVYANTAGGYTLDDNEAYSIHRSQDEAKDAAQANHVAQIMSALGLAPQGEQG
jgi:hypothetical protein